MIRCVLLLSLAGCAPVSAQGHALAARRELGTTKEYVQERSERFNEAAIERIGECEKKKLQTKEERSACLEPFQSIAQALLASKMWYDIAAQALEEYEKALSALELYEEYL